MKRTLKNLFVVTAWLYAVVVVIWFFLHSWVGDTIWWLALLNSFTPFFFLPLLLLVPACILFKRRFLSVSAIVPALLFVLLYGCQFLPSWPVSKGRGDKPLTIMSFNVWGGSRSKETAWAIVDNGVVPDIVALQELTPDMATVVVEELGDTYPYRVLDPGEQYRGMGILSRYRLAELDSSYLADPNWQVQVVQVEINGGTFTFYNVHPIGTNVLVYLEQGASMAGEVRAGFEARHRLIRWLLGDIQARSTPVIVAGDFNSTEQSDVYTLLTHDLTDAHRAIGWGFGHTFPAYAGSFRGIPIIRRQMRIDMILYSQEFVGVSSRVGSVYGESDHLPLLVWMAEPR